MKTLPISISVPYGLSIGIAGMLPYFPLPAKTRRAVLDPMEARDGGTAAPLAVRAHGAMSAKRADLTAGRVPFFGHALGGATVGSRVRRKVRTPSLLRQHAG